MAVHRARALSDIRGLGRLTADALAGLATLVETLHHTIARGSAPLGAPVKGPMDGISGLVYRSIRGAVHGVASGVDALLGEIAPLLEQETSSARRDALRAALGGVLGDHLEITANPLAIPMRLRRGGVALDLTRAALAHAIPDPRGRVLLLVHGLCFTDLQWKRNGHDHGAALAREAAATSRPLTEIYLFYNSGRHVSDNGRDLAAMLEVLSRAWPVPIVELALLCHSMGGLVARSACAHGAAAGHRWLDALRDLVFLGTPHEGAPLERGGNWVNVILDASPYTSAFASLAKIRSAGITDLRHGSVLAADDVARDRFATARKAARARTAVPLPEGVAGYAVAASVARSAADLKGRLLGDGLVPLASALGHHAGPEGSALFAPGHQSIAYGVSHLGLLSSKKVYRQIRGWLLSD